MAKYLAFLQVPDILTVSVVTVSSSPLLKLSFCYLSRKGFLFVRLISYQLIHFPPPVLLCLIDKESFSLIAAEIKKKSGKLIWQSNIAWQQRDQVYVKGLTLNHIGLFKDFFN